MRSKMAADGSGCVVDLQRAAIAVVGGFARPAGDPAGRCLDAMAWTNLLDELSISKPYTDMKPSCPASPSIQRRDPSQRS